MLQTGVSEEGVKAYTVDGKPFKIVNTDGSITYPFGDGVLVEMRCGAVIQHYEDGSSRLLRTDGTEEFFFDYLPMSSFGSVDFAETCVLYKEAKSLHMYDKELDITVVSGVIPENYDVTPYVRYYFERYRYDQFYTWERIESELEPALFE